MTFLIFGQWDMRNYLNLRNLSTLFIPLSNLPLFTPLLHSMFWITIPLYLASGKFYIPIGISLTIHLPFLKSSLGDLSFPPLEEPDIKEILTRLHRTDLNHTERQGCFK